MKFEAKYIFNHFFIIGLMLLFFNDHFLKETYGNWFTGKLSDVAGVFILPFFLSYFFPKYIKQNILFTVLFFVFWKLPISDGCIDLYNQFAPIGITRVVDYTDLFVIAVLPFSYIVLYWIKNKNSSIEIFQKIPQFTLIIIATVVFMATSPPKSHYFTESSGNLRFNTSLKISEDEQIILKKLKNESILVRKDSLLIKELHHFSAAEYSEKKHEYRYYIVDELTLDNEVIEDVQFSFYTSEKEKTKLYLNAMNVTENLMDSLGYSALQKRYQNKIKQRFKTAID
ncbi:hypothetical protein ACFQO1_05650 [Jejudonia soesokkakensis]|uniref:VanZ-like domain-containing protein n=1 Tax=Jejudonia soesokkakensis TaxID=1323432 RepID=A0ABW2MTL5_9FLAO